MNRFLRRQGFSTLEILVALTLFAVISGSAFLVLRQSTVGNQQADRKSSFYRQASMARLLLRLDLKGRLSEPLYIAPGTPDALPGLQFLRFRQDWNPGEEIQKVFVRWYSEATPDGDILVREVTEPSSAAILQNQRFDAMKLRALHHEPLPDPTPNTRRHRIALQLEEFPVSGPVKAPPQKMTILVHQAVTDLPIIPDSNFPTYLRPPPTEIDDDVSTPADPDGDPVILG